MPDETILSAIPHRAPMLLVDEIVSRDEDSIVCRKTFDDKDWFRLQPSVGTSGPGPIAVANAVA